MPRKKVNGNIIGARWQGIRLCEEIIAVNRRIGGLEMSKSRVTGFNIVNRRIGGLEIVRDFSVDITVVNRRIGGLEIKVKDSTSNLGG